MARLARGLTLLETMVTVALLTAATALVFPAMVSRLGSLTFDEAVLQVQSSLRLAQAEAAREGVAVRIEASRPERGGRWVVVSVPFGEDEDPASAWVSVARSGEDLADGAPGVGGMGEVGPVFPLPDAALPAEAIGAIAGKVLYRLPKSVSVERAAAPDGSDGGSLGSLGAEGGFGLDGFGPAGGGGAAVSAGTGSVEMDGLSDARSITLAVVLSDGSMVAAPGAAVVSARGRLAFVGVDAWSGRATVGVWETAGGDGPEDDAAEMDDLDDGAGDRASDGVDDALVPGFAAPAFDGVGPSGGGP